MCVVIERCDWMIVIVDYGLGNISNVKCVIEYLGYEVVVLNILKIID